MKAVSLIICLFLLCSSAFSQTNFLQEGNQFLDKEMYAEAEQTFKKAIESDRTNTIYQCQLALSLMSQKKFQEAQGLIDGVLAKDSLNVGALWYGGMNSFLNEKGDLRKAIWYFNKILPYLEPTSGQYFSANWFMGKSYRILLGTDGLSYKEVSRMLDAYKTYVRYQPQADDAAEIKSYITAVEKNRAPDNVKNWIFTSKNH